MNEFIKKIVWSKKAIHFWAAFFFVFFLTFSFLFIFNLIPSGLSNSLGTFFGYNSQDENFFNSKINLSGLNKNNEISEDPVRIVIGKIGIDQIVSNPETTDVEILDSYLLKGVVRYPGSGRLGEKNNLLLFGHSTGLKNVKNQAFKAFNNLGTLVGGDEIAVMSENNAYLYRVTSVKKVSAEEALVKFEAGESKLTLSTCDTFGEKQDRFVVEAVLNAKYKI